VLEKVAYLIINKEWHL